MVGRIVAMAQRPNSQISHVVLRKHTAEFINMSATLNWIAT